MRLVLFCLAVWSSNSAVVHVSGADVSLECPAQFADNKDNAITVTVNKAAIDGVICSSDPYSLVFGFQRRTEQSGSLLCSATYPCTSPAPVTATGTCGCTKQEGDIFTYTFLFKANKTTDEGGKFHCQICLVSEPALRRFSPDSCNKITVTTVSDTSDEEVTRSNDPGLAMRSTIVGVVVFAMAIGGALVGYKMRSSSGHNVHTNTRSDTPPPAVGSAGQPADRGVAATLDLNPTDEEAGEKDADASDATDVSDTPPPTVGSASQPADRGVAATVDLNPDDSDASRGSDVSQT